MERISMTYLPAYDHDNGWEPTPGAGGADPDVTPKTLYYMTDIMGSTIGLLTQDGRLSARYHYDEFGMVLDSKKFDVNWPGPDNLYGYTGLEYDYYTDLNYARARYYKPEIGRFISEDTYKGEINNPQSLNLYTYVHNNPLIYTDPTGNWCESADGKHSFPGSCGNTKGTGSNDAESDGKWITFNGHKMEQYYYDTSNDSVSDLPWYEELLFGAVTGGVGGAASKFLKTGFDDVVTSAGKYFAKGTGKVPKRDELLNVAENQKLKNAIDQIYRPGAKVGDGGTADKIREELINGEITHIKKGFERIANLEKIMRTQNLSPSDLKIAKGLLDDLKDALKGVEKP